MAASNQRPIDRSGPAKLEELGLTDEQLAAIAVSDAQRAVRGFEALRRKLRAGLCRRAQGDPDRVAAFVAKYSSS